MAEKKAQYPAAQSFHPPAPTTGRSRRGSKASRKSVDKFSIKHKISVRLRPRSAVSGGPSRKFSGPAAGLLPPRSISPHQHLKPGFLSRPVTPIDSSSVLEPPSSSLFFHSIPRTPDQEKEPQAATAQPQEQQQSPPKQPTPRSSSNPESSSSSESNSSSTPPRRSKSAENVSAPFTAPPGPRLIPRTQSSPTKPDGSATVSSDAEEAWRILRRKEFTLRIQEEVLKVGRRRLQQEREELEKERRGFREERRRWWRERVGLEGRVRIGGKSRDRDDAAGETDRTLWSETESSDAGGMDEEELGARSSGEDEDGATERPESLRSRSESDTTYSSTASTESASGSTSWSRRRPSSSTDSKEDIDRARNESTATRLTQPSSSSPSCCVCAASASESARQPPPDQLHTYATYTLAWTSLAHSSAAIPFPTPTLLPDGLVLSHSTASTTNPSTIWPQETVIKQNAASFVLAGHNISSTLTSLPDVSSPPPQSYIPAPALHALSNKQLTTLVSALRRELRRWHEDSLARRVGSELDQRGCAECRASSKRDRQKASGSAAGAAEKTRNDALVADERVRAVFRAFTELRDEVLAEVRAREEDAVRMKGGETANGMKGSRDGAASRGDGKEGDWCQGMGRTKSHGCGGAAGGIRSEDFI
ncbi:hypothetical protein BC567DRAFT_209026 [Phyllosticta citribraziliensis]